MDQPGDLLLHLVRSAAAGAGRADLDPGHPQFGLAQLLGTIKCQREDVEDWFAVKTNPARETLLSETLRPAPTTDAWRRPIWPSIGSVSPNSWM